MEQKTKYSKKFETAATQIGTLCNGKVYVGKSTISGWGLFAGVEFEKGDIVTAYGGMLGNAQDYKTPKWPITHVRTVHYSLYVLDGFACSCLLKHPKSRKWKQVLLDYFRSPLYELRARAWDNLVTCSHCSERPVERYLRHSGLGYMMNSPGDKKDGNVRTLFVYPFQDREHIYPYEVFFVATRTIAKGEELFSTYSNNEEKTF